MIRIRIGASWKEDPQVRGALRRACRAQARSEAVREIVDVVAIEVDGVDIAAGRTEGSVLSAAEGLVRAVARLVAGDSQASVQFQDGAVELVIRRRGGSALLSVVALGRPARVLARDVEVDLEALAGAARLAAATLCEDLAEAEPLSVAEPALRRLLRTASRLRAPPASPPGLGLPDRARPHRPVRRRDAPSCSFELLDDEGLIRCYRGAGPDLGSLLAPGRVTLRDPGGAEILSVPGVPFLLLRDLAAAAARLVAAAQAGEPRFAAALALSVRRGTAKLEIDLARGALSVDGREAVPCPPLLLARALLEAAVDFCGAVVGRNPRQAQNGYLVELRAGASDCLAQLGEMLAGDLVSGPSPGVRTRATRRAPRAPLGPGRMKRLAFRRAWGADVGAPAGPALFRFGELVVASGAAATLAADATSGAVRWRAAGAAWASLAGDALLLADGQRLTCLDAAAGRRRWNRPFPELEGVPPRGLWPLPGGRGALLGSATLFGLDLCSGRAAWRFDPPAASGVAAAAFGALLVAGADTGMLYGVDAQGRVAWRHRGPGPLAAPPLAFREDCLALCRTERGASLLAVDPATGRRRWEAPLDFAPAGSPVPFAGLLAVAGAVAGDPVVAALESGGAPAWASAPSLPGGSLALASVRGGLVAKAAGGACVAFDRAGAEVWSRSRQAADPPAGNLPPVAARGAILVASDGVEALDEATGRLLGSVPGVSPARMLVGGDLSLFALDVEGLLTAVRLATHLSVV